MAKAVLTISSKNYSSWCLRGWLMAKWSGLDFEEKMVSPDDPSVRAELLLQSSSILVPALTHDDVTIWDTLAIGEYLNEKFPRAGLLPKDTAARAHCRAICGEMHSGFAALRSALPVNLKSVKPGFIVWSAAQADIDRILKIWQDCFAKYGGPYLFGKRPTIADAMYAPVCTRFRTYCVKLPPDAEAYCERIMTLPTMVEWIATAKAEPEEVPELDAEF
ncbi:MAG TPA: glutathione S-transferase family protein [Stellaceae bacterium]|jgi:glutathione S-transferase|nr:glutathione S-transferase family protein [Stellaceae bacterium]